MSTTSIPTVAAKIFALLKPLKSADRKKAIAGAMAMLGETALDPETGRGEGGKESSTQGPWGNKAKRWISDNDLTDDQLEQAFHRNDDGTVDVLKTWGTTNKEKTINSYLLLGASRLLANDKPEFSDADAMSLCKRFGCYDKSNHSRHRDTALGNRVTGNRNKGFTLTAPGLSGAAVTVKQIAGSSSK